MTITTQKYIRKLNKMSTLLKRDCLYEINDSHKMDFKY